MACLAQSPDRLVPTPELARMTAVPPNYLAKVLQVLSSADLIQGRRGVGGGYRLARPAAEITMLEVLNSVCKIEPVTACPLGLNAPGMKLCALHKIMNDASEQLINLFGGISLEQIVNESSAMQQPLCDKDKFKQMGASHNKNL